jgi:nucleotide-binding universal stress UspA family protein
MILVSYDGSDDARAAIDRVAQLMPGAEATVLTIWEKFMDTVTRSGAMGIGVGYGGMYSDTQKVDDVSEQSALENATEGTKRATAAGLVARPKIATRQYGVADTVLAVAGELDADLIVLGTRGLGGVKSFLLGSVSHAVVQHADRAVLVVPSAGLAEKRSAWAREADAAVEAV